jgi:hypothetical protein
MPYINIYERYVDIFENQKSLDFNFKFYTDRKKSFVIYCYGFEAE